MSVSAIATLDQYNETKKSKRPAMFFFSANWSAPCKNIRTVFNTFPTKHKTVDFYEVDIDDAKEIVTAVGGVSNTPTFILFKDGRKIDSVIGAEVARLTELVNKASA